MGHRIDITIKPTNTPIKRIMRGSSIFKDYWFKHITTDSRLYVDVVETLEYLKEKDLIITSNGVKEIIEKLLDNFKIKKYFKEIISGDEPDCIKPTACPLNMVFDIFAIKKRNIGKEKIMIIGDMDIDIKAGKMAGIKTCAVTYGFGNREKIKKADPDFIIDNFSELRKIIE